MKRSVKVIGFFIIVALFFSFGYLTKVLDEQNGGLALFGKIEEGEYFLKVNNPSSEELIPTSAEVFFLSLFANILAILCAIGMFIFGFMIIPELFKFTKEVMSDEKK